MASRIAVIRGRVRTPQHLSRRCLLPGIARRLPDNLLNGYEPWNRPVFAMGWEGRLSKRFLS